MITLVVVRLCKTREYDTPTTFDEQNYCSFDFKDFVYNVRGPKGASVATWHCLPGVAASPLPWQGLLADASQRGQTRRRINHVFLSSL